MDEELNMSLRKFLKRLGVTSQQAVEEAVRQAREDGALPESGALPVRATVRIGPIGLEHTVEGEIRLGTDG